MDIHILVSKLKDLAVELGRTPTKVEFMRASEISRYRLEMVGGFNAVVRAAGLKEYRKSDRRIDLTVFESSIENHLKNYEPVDKSPVVVDSPTFAVISDIHWPFEHPKVVARFIEYVGDEKPDFAFINGDAADMYSHGKFPRSHNIFTPREEQQMAREKNEKFWIDIKKAHPKIKCVQMLGNHDIRPMKRILEAYPEAEDWIVEKLKEMFTFDGVETVYDVRQEYIVGDCMIFHGYKSQAGGHRDHALYNCATGHTHRGSVVYRRIRGQTLWELNSGLAGDPEAKGLTYTPSRITEWTPGFGARDARGPRFIAL